MVGPPEEDYALLRWLFQKLENSPIFLNADNNFESSDVPIWDANKLNFNNKEN
jgi:hypothetical protein